MCYSCKAEQRHRGFINSPLANMSNNKRNSKVLNWTKFQSLFWGEENKVKDWQGPELGADACWIPHPTLFLDVSCETFFPHLPGEGC